MKSNRASEKTNGKAHPSRTGDTDANDPRSTYILLYMTCVVISDHRRILILEGGGYVLVVVFLPPFDMFFVHAPFSHIRGPNIRNPTRAQGAVPTTLINCLEGHNIVSGHKRHILSKIHKKRGNAVYVAISKTTTTLKAELARKPTVVYFCQTLRDLVCRFAEWQLNVSIIWGGIMVFVKLGHR